MCCLCAYPGTWNPGYDAGEPGPESLSNPEQTWSDRLPTRLGAAAGLFCTPGGGLEFCSRRFVRVSFLATQRRAAQTRAPRSWDEPAAQPQTPGSAPAGKPRSEFRAGWALVRARTRTRSPGGRRVPAAGWLRGVLLRPLCEGGRPAPPGPGGSESSGEAGCGLALPWETFITPREGDWDGGGNWELRPAPRQEPSQSGPW